MNEASDSVDTTRLAATSLRETASVPTDDERARLIRHADDEPAHHVERPDSVYHFSEDGTLRRFAPHVPQTNPSHPPAVWAIDADHSPLYWFPRDCPRISVWATNEAQQAVLSERFETEATRICAAESGWVDRIRTGRVYRYSFDATRFQPWTQADGQYICEAAVTPVSVEPIDDLLSAHAAAAVELRFTPRLGTLMDAMLASGLPFSFVRIRDARR